MTRLFAPIAVARWANRVKSSGSVDYIGIADSTGRALWRNDAYKRAMGGDPDGRLTGRPIDECYPAWAARLIREQGLPTAARDGSWVAETALRAFDGREMPVSQMILARKGTDGEVDFYATIMRDMTDRRLAEEQARERQRFIEAVTDAHPSILYTYDLSLRRIVWANARTADVLGYRPDQITAMSADAGVWLLHPDDVERIGDTRARFGGLADGQVVEDEYRIRHADGSWRWHRSRELVFNRDADGLPAQVIGAAEDVTERKWAEDTFRVLFEKSSDAHLLIHEQDGIIDCNEAAVRMLRCGDKTDVLAIHPAAFSPEFQPDGRSWREGAAEMDAIARRDGSHRFDWWHKRQDGDIFPCEVTLTPVEVAGRSLLLVVWHDLTERNRAAEALRESEERFRLLADSAPVIIWMGHPDHGGCSFMNRTGIDFFGRTTDELAGDGWVDLVYPDDLGAFEAALREASASRLPLIHECRMLRADGAYRWLSNRAVPRILPDGAYVGYIGSMSDTTDRREVEEIVAASERRYRFLAESIPQLVWSCDGEGRAIDFNRRWGEYTGQPLEESLGNGWAVAIHPDDRDRTFACWSNSVTGVHRYEIEYRIRRASDGQHRWHLAQGEPMRDEHGRAVRWFGTCTDIHDQKEATAALRVAMEAAEAATRAKSEFLANMSHEIRTPMNGILGMTELALDTDLTAEQREYLGLVKQSADGLLTVINDILDFSKIEAGKLDLDPISFGLRDCIEGTLKALALRAHSKGLELACRISPDLPDALIGDPGRIRQVLFNLVGNAIKFTDGGEVVIDVEAADPSSPIPGLHVSVRDSGIGIPADKLGSIFAPFEQADGGTTRRFGGTGLGLAISTRLVTMMDGRIWVESEPGRGSTFHFTARLTRDEASADHPKTPGPDALRGLSVLVADDHATNRRILEEMLSSWGMNARAVDGGRAALDELRRASEAGDSYPIILADSKMPDIDGFALAAQIRDDPRLAGSAILILSSDDRRGDAVKSRALGIFTYLTKPVGQSELKSAMLGSLSLGADAASGANGRLSECALREAVPPLRILLAEDNFVNQKVAVRLLEKRGHSVRVAKTGREAIESLCDGRFDLILMDVHMPEMGGLEAVERIREGERDHGGHIPIIAMTASAMVGDRERCLGVGMDAYVSKPVREHELWSAIREVMPGRTATADPPAVRPDEGAVDVGKALALAGDDVCLLAEIVAMFQDERPGRIASIRAALADARELRAAAHAFKGTIAHFGPSAALTACVDIERLAIAGDLAEAEGLLATLDLACERLADALEQLLRSDIAV